MMFMDNNGDAEGNYTLIAFDKSPTKGNGLYPIAYFVGKEEGTNLPVRASFFAVTLFYARKEINVIENTQLQRAKFYQFSSTWHNSGNSNSRSHRVSFWSNYISNDL